MFTCASRSFPAGKRQRSVSAEKHLSAPFRVVRCALPHFAPRNDFLSLTQQGLSPAESFAAALNYVVSVFRPHEIDSEWRKGAGVYRT